MVRRILAVLVALFVAGTLLAQNYHVTVKLQDAGTGEPVGFATVSLTPEKGQPKYALADGNGKAEVEKVHPGKYTLKAELLGYKNYEKVIEVHGNMDLGTVKMDLDQKTLDAASVTATGNPIIIKKDTIEYNASSFKISDDNMLVDLLKKLPGIEVGEDGTITSNGETVSKITIAGKTFFLDDPQLASQNIPAKLIEKVKVVKKKSEQAEFTGIDDGEEETVIDLTVQKGMMNGIFGNAMLGGGHDLPAPAKTDVPNDWRWQGAFMGGQFTETSQISVILNANNTNNRGFNDLSGSMMNSMMGGGGGMGRGMGGFGGNSNGITTSWMAGVNGNWDLLGDKMDLGGNYLYNGSVVDVTEKTYKETYMTDGSTLVSNNNGLSSRFTDGHRFGVRFEHKFSENTSILFQPQFNFGRGSYVQQTEFDSHSLAKDGTTETPKNDGFTNNRGENSNWQARGFLLFRQRLGIPGRTVSVNADWNFSNNVLQGLTQSLTATQFDAQGKPDETTATKVNQRFDQSTRSQSASARLVYTEPLGGNFYLEGSYNIRWSLSTTEKLTYNSGAYAWGTNPFTMGMGQLNYERNGETLDDAYTNNILNWSLTHNLGLAFMYQDEALRAQLGASAVPTRTYNKTNDAKPYDPGYIWNFSPRAMLFYDFNDNFNVRLFYFGNSSQPSTSQLNPVLDNSNPLSLALGDPYLNPYFSHRLRSDLEFSNKQTFFTARLHLEGGMVQNPITNASWYDDYGRSYSFPVNGHNSYSGGIRLMINAPIAKSNFSISNMTNASYSMSGSYVGGVLNMDKYLTKDASGSVTDFKYADFHDDYYVGSALWNAGFKDNTTHALSLTERLRATYRSDYVEVIIGGRTRMSKPWYTMEGVTPVAATWNNQVSGSFKWTIGESGVELSTDANYNWYNGYTSPQDPELVWNASISTPLFRRQATLSLKAYDLLDQAKNVRVATTDNYYSETRNNTLGRYIMLSFTWRFGNFGKAGEQMRSRMGGGPGPGGFRGGPPMGGGRPF
ncbi:MAG: outer membrane beta-barrel protein [Bacteroidales bacterium]|nr:outer membrane beta-barrel protein [Bacteroidales bacterium]